MADVNPEVAAFFKNQLEGWKNALARWHKKCSGKMEENKKRMKPSFPVADRRGPMSEFKGRAAAVSDATPYGYPSKTVDEQKTDDAVAKQAANCKKTIEYIQKMMEFLNNARTTGRFPSIRHHTIAVRKKPNFLTVVDRSHNVDRGEVVEVLHKKGDWFQVKTADAEGWVHKTDLIPTMPIEADFSAPTVGRRDLDDTWIETGVSDKAGAF